MNDARINQDGVNPKECKDRIHDAKKIGMKLVKMEKTCHIDVEIGDGKPETTTNLVLKSV